MTLPAIPRLYAIADRTASTLPLIDQVGQLVAGGAKWIQLRDKISSPRDFHRDVVNVLRFAREKDVAIIVNDRADIALATAADGVHLGQTDLPPEAARRLLGDSAIIGYSTHNLAQVREAARQPVDYVAFGPIFQTKTKENPDPSVGLELLAAARLELAGIPLVAIGGIEQANARSVIESGADAVAVISALVGSPEGIAERTSEFSRILHV
jgi:thiamine-phosphate pyrophosphorylase